jgi:hypothetical protein
MITIPDHFTERQLRKLNLAFVYARIQNTRLLDIKIKPGDIMDAHLKHLPAILLIAKDQYDRVPEKELLKQSRFRTWEAMNVFDALEGMTDFTLKNRPDVVVLNVGSMLMDFELVLGLLLNGTANESEFPIFVLSGERRMIRNDDVFEGEFTEIMAQLEELIPQTSPQVRRSVSKILRRIFRLLYGYLDRQPGLWCLTLTRSCALDRDRRRDGPARTQASLLLGSGGYIFKR